MAQTTSTTPDLMGIVSRQITPDVIRSVAAQLSEDRDSTASALSAAVPSTLTALSDVASSDTGARHLKDVIDEKRRSTAPSDYEQVAVSVGDGAGRSRRGADPGRAGTTVDLDRRGGRERDRDQGGLGAKADGRRCIGRRRRAGAELGRPGCGRAAVDVSRAAERVGEEASRPGGVAVQRSRAPDRRRVARSRLRRTDVTGPAIQGELGGAEAQLDLSADLWWRWRCSPSRSFAGCGARARRRCPSGRR